MPTPNSGKKRTTISVFSVVFVVVFVVNFMFLLADSPSVGADDDNALANQLLYWAPPELQNPTTVQIPVTNPGSTIKLDHDRDYILKMPDQPIRYNLTIAGGHNVVLIGGEIEIGWQGVGASILSRTGIRIGDVTGTIHIEGVYIHGDDLTEGISIDAPEAIIQLQNIVVDAVRARDEVNFSDNHPDLIQTYGNVRELRVDRFSGVTDYQGFFLKADSNGPHNSVNIRRSDITGLPTARYLFWINSVGWNEGDGYYLIDWAGTVTLSDVWLNVPAERGRGFPDAIWPPGSFDYPYGAVVFNNDAGDLCASWPEELPPPVDGYLCEGLPENGSFVTPDEVGVGYVSPGYLHDEIP